MQSFFALGALATLLAQANATPPAAAAPTWNSIHLRSCTILGRGRMSFQTGGIELVYVNRASVAAKSITFAIVYRKQPGVVTDHGTFSPGTVIDHTFTNVFYAQGFEGPTPEICRVRKVVFADGTVSTAPEPAAP